MLLPISRQNALNGLINDLGSDRIGIEAVPLRLQLITRLFRAADNGRFELVTSSVTLP